MKKQLLVAGIIAAPTLALAGTAIASHNGGISDSMKDQYAEKFASRFNLNKEEVSAFMSEQHEAKRAEMEAKVAESLKSAGFTDAQITELQAKKQEQRDEHQAWHDANPNATTEERKAHRDAEKAEFEAWAKEKGIDLTKVRETLKGLMPNGRGHGGPRMMGKGNGQPSDAPTS